MNVQVLESSGAGSAAANSRQFFTYPILMVKGVCILGVIIIHVTSVTRNVGASDLLRIILAFLNSSARFAVPLFIALSGFYLSLNEKNEHALPFYRRTLKHIILPYVGYSLIYSFPTFVRNGNILRVLWELLTASASSHLWFGLTILQLYLLHPVLSRVYRRSRNRGLLTLAALLLQIAWNLSLALLFEDPDPLRVGAPIWERLGALFFASGIGYFYGGYFLSAYADKVVQLLQKGKTIWIGLLGWVIVSIGLFWFWGNPVSLGIKAVTARQAYLADISEGLVVPLLCAFSLIIIFPLFHHRIPGQNFILGGLNSLGLYSYGIYYLHELSSWSIRWILRHLFLINGTIGAYYILVFVFTVLISLYLNKFLARLPLGKYAA